MSEEIKETAAKKNEEAYAKEKVGAVIYGISAYISLFRLYDFVLTFVLLVCGALSLLCTHAIITYEKGKPFRI